MIKRAYDLRILSEASYRRAFVHLNKTGARKHEPGEPPAEQQTLLRASLQELEPDFTVEDIAQHLGLSSKELRSLSTPTLR
ncbi:MAG TPA: hypothetical protein VF989_11145 [Polyangiaceae bacterium]